MYNVVALKASIHQATCCWQLCGYFDLVSNMLPEIEQPSGLHTLGNFLLATKQHVAKNRTSFYFWQHVAYKIKVTINVASNMLPSVWRPFYFWQHVAYKIKVTTKLPATCCLVYGGLNSNTCNLGRTWFKVEM